MKKVNVLISQIYHVHKFIEKFANEITANSTPNEAGAIIEKSTDIFNFGKKPGIQERLRHLDLTEEEIITGLNELSFLEELYEVGTLETFDKILFILNLNYQEALLEDPTCD